MDTTEINSIERSELLQVLRGRRDETVDTWRSTITGTSLTPVPAAEVRRRLKELVGRTINLLLFER